MPQNSVMIVVRTEQHERPAMIADVYMLCVNFSHTDVLSSGAWSTFKGLEDPELRRLAERLPTSILNSKGIWEPLDIGRHGLLTTN